MSEILERGVFLNCLLDQTEAPWEVEVEMIRCHDAALRLALAEAHARIADLENPDFVNCDGLHADGKYPNTPHRPIGINRLYPCPACAAERERDEARLDHHNCADKGRRLEARLATVLDERDAALALSRARETDGAVREDVQRALVKLEEAARWHQATVGRRGTNNASEEDLLLAAHLMVEALSSPPRPETKAPRECGGRCHDAIDSRSPCLECAAEMHGPELVPRPAPPADAASRDGSLKAQQIIDGTMDLFPGADRQAIKVAVGLALKPPADAATEAVRRDWTLCPQCGVRHAWADPDDPCAPLSTPAHAPSAKETRT